MAHPSHRYLKYLLLKAQVTGTPIEWKEVCSLLERIHILSIAEDKFKDMAVMTAKPPRGLRFHSPQHKVTAEFMKKHDVYELWNPPISMADVLRMLGSNAQAVETTQVLIAGRLESAEISEKLLKKHHLKVSAEAVDMLRKFFWDVEATSYSEWEILLRGRSMRSSILASLHSSPDQARYRAGFQPKVEGKKTLREALRGVYFRLEATRYMPDNEEVVGMLTRLTKELGNIFTVLYGDGAGLDDILKELRVISMKTWKPKIAALKSLAPNGNHSGSGVAFLTDGKGDDDDDRSDAGATVGRGPEEADA